MAESKNKKMLVKTKIDLEIEKEKTRQLLLLRDIKKMELKIIGQEKYNKKNGKSLDLFNQLDYLNVYELLLGPSILLKTSLPSLSNLRHSSS